MKFKRDVTAEEIALAHKHLGDAIKTLRKIGSARGGFVRNPLTKADMHQLSGVCYKLVIQMLRLEEPFVQATSRSAPFYSAENPDEWLEWLAARKQEKSNES